MDYFGGLAKDEGKTRDEVIKVSNCAASSKLGLLNPSVGLFQGPRAGIYPAAPCAPQGGGQCSVLPRFGQVQWHQRIQHSCGGGTLQVDLNALCSGKGVC